jgi:hypothetical protein
MEELAIKDSEEPHSSRQEKQRLEVLERYPLTSWTDPELNRIVKSVSQICEVPIALISIVDTDRQWFKVNIGLPFDETPRAESFCAHALDQRGLLIVPDAMQDDRFGHLFLVTGKTNVRFYAGAPLRTPDGLTLGTLCIMDVVPRVLTDSQKWMLASMAEQVMQRFERQRRSFDFGLSPDGLLPARLHDFTLVRLRSFVCTNSHRGLIWLRLLSFLAGPILSGGFAAAYIAGGFLGLEARPSSCELTLQARPGTRASRGVAALVAAGPDRIREMHSLDLRLCGKHLPAKGKYLKLLDRAPEWERPSGPATAVVRIDLASAAIVQEFREALVPLGGAAG